MTFPVILFTLVAALLLLRLPRQLASLPLLVGASYMTLGPTLDVGPFHFTVIRILIAAGFVRILTRGERLKGWNVLDGWLVAWATWAVVVSVFHEHAGETLVFRLGLAYNALGLYFLLRIFIQDSRDLLVLCAIILIALIPIAIEMAFEAKTGRNLFSCFGGVSELSEVRNGKIRAQGPFAHSILAGTVGAVCLPVAMLFWNRTRRLALAGLLACGSIVLYSRSSGPIMTCFFALLGLATWKVRAQLPLLRWGVLAGVLALMLFMQAPVYYLLARIDLTGSSTGYHRAILIEAAVTRLSEWWLFGTDRTRHWTPNAGFGEDTDVTNHYIRVGIWGGLPLLILFIGVLTAGFGSVGHALRLRARSPSQEQYLVWTLGAVLFAHAATMMSVSYFDQSVFFLYLLLAAIGSLRTTRSLETRTIPVRQVQHEGNFCYHC